MISHGQKVDKNGERFGAGTKNWFTWTLCQALSLSMKVKHAVPEEVSRCHGANRNENAGFCKRSPMF